MSSECNITWSILVMLGFILAAGAHGETVCTVRSSKGKDVLVGSNFTVSCFFNKPCTKVLLWNGEPIKYEQSPSSDKVFVHVNNLTTKSILTCRCEGNPEPCGIDITPGYPPDSLQNLTCVRKTTFGNVSCTWTTGRYTKLETTCHLRVQGDPHGYESAMNSSGFCWATFPIKSTTMSQLIVSLNVSNTLGSKSSGPHIFTLSNIVKPSVPNIIYVDCSSRWCHLHTDNHSMNLVEVQYETSKRIWKNLQSNGQRSLIVSSLQPHSTYKFQIRRKINQTIGLWSDWSEAKKATTKEEAPDKALDVWYLQEPKASQTEKCFRIFWKELSGSDAKGKIQQYNITVLEQECSSREIIAYPPRRNESVCCCHCSVSVSAVNSKGHSPKNFIKLRSPQMVSDLQSHKPLNYHSVALSWQRLAIAGNRNEYVVHWHPVGNIQGLQWIRVAGTTANITGLRPQECYQGAVTALNSEHDPLMVSIKDLSTWQSAPEQGPDLVPVKKKSDSLTVKEFKIPQEKRRGCLKNYTVYLTDKLKGEIRNYNVSYPVLQHTISHLSPGQCYNVWVTAWTDAGQGPKGNDLPFCTLDNTETLLSLVILSGGAVLLACLFLLCICQFSSVQRRFLKCCQCLLPRVIPDPANSKCAKSYDKEIMFYLQQCDSSWSEEPENVEVEEVPYNPSFPCTYIKSFSHGSDSSDNTQITRNTDISEDYISTHGAISGGEEDEEEERELDEFEFFPSIRSPFLEPLVSTGGKLTLDVVKIDCSEFLDCT